MLAVCDGNRATLQPNRKPLRGLNASEGMAPWRSHIGSGKDKHYSDAVRHLLLNKPEESLISEDHDLTLEELEQAFGLDPPAQRI